MKNSEAEKQALELFQSAYNTSVAYKHFIDVISEKNKVSITNFSEIPLMDKNNYIKKYPMEQRLYNGKEPADFYMIAASSGSTGIPTFWPRDIKKDTILAQKQEDFCEEHFSVSTQRTLCVVTFGLGVWTAGMLTSRFAWETAQNNKFTVITPGMDKENILKMIEGLYRYYDQVILFGYPPFLTDFVEFAKEKKFDLRKANTKIFCTSERFRENWRTVMAKNVSKNNKRTDIVGFYACSDAGIIGIESKFSIELLHHASNNNDLAYTLFGSKDTPSLVVYNPMSKYIEIVNDEIVLTVDQPIPLIRYNIHDRGGILTNDQVQVVCEKYRIPFVPLESNLQYLYIYGRSDSVKLTANIYIEDVKYCLEHSIFQKKLTGYFKYGIEETQNGQERLKVMIYTKKNEEMNEAAKALFEKEFYDNLLIANNDFKMIQSGIKIEPFHFIYEEDDPQKYKNYKLRYFL